MLSFINIFSQPQSSKPDLKQQIIETLKALKGSGQFSIEMNNLLKRGGALVEKIDGSDQHKLNESLLGIILYTLTKQVSHGAGYGDKNVYKNFSFESLMPAYCQFSNDFAIPLGKQESNRDKMWESIFTEFGRRVLDKTIPFLDQFDGRLSPDENVQKIISKFLPAISAGYQFTAESKKTAAFVKR